MEESKKSVKANSHQARGLQILIGAILIAVAGVYYYVGSQSQHGSQTQQQVQPIQEQSQAAAYQQCVKPYQDQITQVQTREALLPSTDNSSDGTIIAAADQGIQNCRSQYPGN